MRDGHETQFATARQRRLFAISASNFGRVAQADVNEDDIWRGMTMTYREIQEYLRPLGVVMSKKSGKIRLNNFG